MYINGRFHKKVVYIKIEHTATTIRILTKRNILLDEYINFGVWLIETRVIT